MPARAKATKNSKETSANIGFEATLWLAADKLRSNIGAWKYKHAVLVLGDDLQTSELTPLETA